MRSIPRYDFHKTKYGDELLIDVVELRFIEKYIIKDPIHTLTYYDITLITDGSGEFIVNNKEDKVVSDDVICSIPGEIRGWKKEQHLNGYALIFEENFLLSFFNDPHFLHHLSFFNAQRKSSKLSLQGELSVRIRQLFQQIKSEINDNASKDNHILRAMLYEVLMLLNRAYMADIDNISSNKVNNRHINAFIQWVRADCSSNQSVQYYADKLCITPNYLNRIVRNTMGISAKAYIQNEALKEAQKLLNYTSLSISEIADKLNYNSPSYFIRFFRKQTGLTPKQYKENYKKHEK